MLNLKDIVKYYGSGESAVAALRGVSINFRENEFVSVLGPSGCGKTTLLNIIGGLDHYTSGDLVISGRSTAEYANADWDAYRNHSIGFVFQSYNLIPHQSVLSNVELALTLSGVPKAERRRRAEDALRRVGLGEQFHKKPNQLSGGQMQRVAIARALVNDPEILLADEPTGALDTETSISVMDLLREVAQEKLVIMVTHNPELAERYSTRIVRLLDGQIVGDTNPFDGKEAAAEKSAAPAAPVKEAAEKKQRKKPNKSTRRLRSMSLGTAFTLSLNNLMTKKGRTFLTSFAGSIGIIGIALILALSNGINIFISRIQEDTLTSYPIMIQEETVDISSMISGFMGEENNAEERENDKVYSSAVFYQLINTMMQTDKTKNNLKAFKTYLESGAFDGIDMLLQYGYDIPLTIYATDRDGNYAKSDIMSLMTKLTAQMTGGSTSAVNSSMTSNFSSYSVWKEALAGKNGSYVSDLLKSQYNLVAGSWPTSANDVLLVIDENNEVNDMTLYALGLKSESEMMALMMAALGGQKVEATSESWNYEEILALRFQLVLPADSYIDRDGDGIYEDVSEDSGIMTPIIRNGKTLRVSGIIRPDPDAVSASANGTLLYTSALTDYMITNTLQCDAVKTQLANTDIDIFTGLPFEIDESTLPTGVAERASAFLAYVASLDNTQKSELYRQILITPSDTYIETVLDGILSKLPTKESIIDLICQQYGSGAIADYLRSYLSSFTLEELHGMLRKILEPSIRDAYAEAGEAQYRLLRETPSSEELEAIITGQILPRLPDRASRTAYILAVYAGSTTMSAETVSAWLATLSEEDVLNATKKAAETEAKAIYAAKLSASGLSPIEDLYTKVIKDAKSAAALDAYLASLSEADLADRYTAFYPDGSAGVTLAENLAKLGAVDRESPSSVSIYVSSFAAKDRVSALINDYNASVTSEEDQITYTDYVALIMSSVTFILNAITYVLVAFVSVSLLVSSIMIGIITYISVLERTKEIGILRAIGASRRDIFRVFNAETLLIGFTAGMIGILTTLLLCLPINLILHFVTGMNTVNAVLPIAGGVILVAISMTLTFLAGLIPAFAATQKDPVVALRSE